MNHYKVYGKEPISVVIEMGLGACISEWEPFIEKIQEETGVLVYERAGVNRSGQSRALRTPVNIAEELYTLLQSLNCEKQVILLAHSQGGLYATAFCMKYPHMVKGLILLDPLSPYDNEFSKVFSAKEYKKSGVDKSSNFKIMLWMARLGLGKMAKKMMESAPPFYYFKQYTSQQKEEILNCVTNTIHAKTSFEEYIEAHKEENLTDVKNADKFPEIPLYLITHSSEMAIEENMQFGGNTKEFATRVEELWQDIMKRYLSYSSKSKWIRADQSTHYIHLMQPELVIEALHEVALIFCTEKERNRHL